jgi:hypothetical protein
VRAAIIGTSLIGLALRLWILFLPGLMSITQYDDGPYFGSAVRLIHGVLPYRDYAFVQPPGITELMAPAALESYLGGTAWALVIARFLCVFAGTAAVVLAGFLVRHRGALAVLLTGGILAIYPPAAESARTVLLEPWLVLFCLAGAVAVFDGDRLTSRTRRLAWGGVAFGFGGAIKVWAIVPVLVIVVLCLPHVRRAAVFAAGVAAGFLIPVLPIAIASPGRFYDEVVVAQLARIGPRLAAWMRFSSMLGISKTLTPATVIALAVTVLVAVIAAQIAASLVTRRLPAPLDWFALVSAALIVTMFLWPAFYAAHYATFLGPFLALSVSLPVARLAEGLASRRAGRDRRQRARPRRGWPGPSDRARAGVLAGAVAQAGRRPATGPLRRPGGEDAADPQGRLRAHRLGRLPPHRQPVHLRRAGLLADGGQPRHRPGARRRPPAGIGRWPGACREQGVASGLQYRRMGAADAEKFGTNTVESRAPRLLPQSLPAGAAAEYLHPVRPGQGQASPQTEYGRMSRPESSPMPHPAGIP